MSNPFHEGELEVQRLAGESDIAESNGAAIAPTIMLGALRFIEQQVMAAVTTEVEGGRLWTRVLFGEPGFLHSANARRLKIERELLLTDDGWLGAAFPGARAGVLVIDLATRRRLRINGTVDELSESAISIVVEESFGNCPKYITRRQLQVRPKESSVADEAIAAGTELDAQSIERIRRADLIFVGSMHPKRGADTSHRGGYPGFIEVRDANRLFVPDYNGNSMFNTMGNMQVNGRASVAIPDFEHKRILHLSGEVDLVWDAPERHNETGGTGRWWTLRVEEWFESAIPAQIEAQVLDYSRYNPERF